MKKWVLLASILLSWLALSSGAPEPQEEPDWLSLLVDAAVAGDREAGLAAAEGWNADEERPPLDYDDLVLLAKLITWEAGSAWLSDELRLCVGEVALNRVASPEFPDTLEAVVYQYGQYVGVNTPAFREHFSPTRPCAEVALRLLLGERILQPQVVFAGHAVQGKVHACSGICTTAASILREPLPGAVPDGEERRTRNRSTRCGKRLMRRSLWT